MKLRIGVYLPENTIEQVQKYASKKGFTFSVALHSLADYALEQLEDERKAKSKK